MNARNPIPGRHQIIIVGGGAGGLVLATRLGDSVGRQGRADITLIDRMATHLWKPLLHEIAAGRMDADAHDIEFVAVAHWHHFRFRQGSVQRLNRAKRELTVSAVRDDDGSDILPERTYRYDTLVFCVGSVGNDYGVPGVVEHAISLDALPDAERFHRKFLAACVRADNAAREGGYSPVAIVIIGAGATGVELAAELRHSTRTQVAYGLDHLDPEKDIRITLVEAAPRILPQLSEKVSLAAARLLAQLKIEITTHEAVQAIDSRSVRLANGQTLPADLIVWAAGIKAAAWLTTLDGLETNRANQLVVTETLQTTRDANICAFGDCAACPWPSPGNAHALVPARAQAAHQQAAVLEKTLRRRLSGGAPVPFRYRDFGSLVSIGERSAVGTLMGGLIGGSLTIQGLVARWMYAALYKMHQASIHGYCRVALDTIGRFLQQRMEPRIKLH